MMSTPLLFRFRQTVAGMPSVLVLALLIFAGVQKAAQIKMHVDDTRPVEISLMEPEPPVVVPAPPAPPRQPTPPEPVKPRVVPTPPRPTPVKPVATQTSVPDNAPSTVREAATEAPAPAAPVPPPAPIPAPAPAPAPVPVAAPARPNTASVEAEYVAKLRAQLNSIKRYPTGREASQQHPRGIAKVWFVLTRDGKVVDSGLETSSNSMLLDDAARKSINRANFAAFPEATWAGQNTHRFTAELEFIPPGG